MTKINKKETGDDPFNKQYLPKVNFEFQKSVANMSVELSFKLSDRTVSLLAFLTKMFYVSILDVGETSCCWLVGSPEQSSNENVEKRQLQKFRSCSTKEREG